MGDLANDVFRILQARDGGKAYVVHGETTKIYKSDLKAVIARGSAMYVYEVYRMDGVLLKVGVDDNAEGATQRALDFIEDWVKARSVARKRFFVFRSGFSRVQAPLEVTFILKA